MLADGAGSCPLPTPPPLVPAAHVPSGTQEIELSVPAGIAEALQPGSSPPGSSLARAPPLPSTATHRPEETHETPVRLLAPVGVELQVGVADAGSALAIAFPDCVTATQTPAAHESPVSELAESKLGVHALAEVGAALASSTPLALRATQRDSLEQDTDCSATPPPIEPRSTQLTPELALVSRSPASSTATHSDPVGQETPVIVCESLADAEVHPLEGLPNATSGLPAPTATHSEADGQETESKEPFSRSLHEDPSCGLPVSTLPFASTAAHSCALAQEMLVIADPPAPTACGEDQETCAAARAPAGVRSSAAIARRRPRPAPGRRSP